jgi:hypothetical protein
VIRTGRLPNGHTWDPLRTGLLENAVSPALSGANGSAELIKYDPDRIDVLVSTESTALLILSENHYPGWRAYVDGASVEVARVDYALRGIVVPPGKHNVSFRYRPKSVLIGFLISLATGLGLAVWLWGGGPKNKFVVGR